MTKTKSVAVIPTKIVVGEIEWSLEEIQELAELYVESTSVTLPKKQIRKTPILQKAMESDAVAALEFQTGPDATLSLTNIGNELIGLL